MNRYQQSRPALGSNAVITLLVNNEATANLLFEEIWLKILAFDNSFSRFKDDSELSYVNEMAGSSVSISNEFYELMKQTIYWTRATKGLFNPFVLPALQTAGYKGSWPSVDKFSAELDYSARQNLQSLKNLKLSKNSICLPSNSALDFGGIGKGYLLDELTNLLDTKHVKDYWISLGGDLICKGFNLEGQPWQVAIAAAENEDEMETLISNENGHKQAIATSGITKRRGSNWHHIIDPRTFKPAITDVLTASVVSTYSATAADIVAKCLVIDETFINHEFKNKYKITDIILQHDNAKIAETKVEV